MIVLLFQSCLLDLQLHHPAAQLIQLRRHGVQLGLDQRARLVHQINRFIRQKAVGDIAV